MQTLTNIKASQQLLATQLDSLNRICLLDVWGHDKPMWMFQPYGVDALTGELTGFFYVWPGNTNLNSSDGALVWLEDNRSMSDQLTLALDILNRFLCEA